MFHFGFRAFADHIKLALQCVLIHAGGAPDKNLLDVGLGGPRDSPDGIGGDGRVPPAEDAEAFLAHDPLENSFAEQPLVAFHRQKNHADAVFAGQRQGETEPGAFAFEKGVRYLDQNAGAVACDRIASAGAAVLQVDEDLDAFEQ